MSFCRIHASFCLLVTQVLVSGWVYARSLPDFTQVVEDNLPAVVIISTHAKASKNRGSNDQYPEYFQFFFGDGFDFPEQEQEPAGSGIILSRDGYILTNYHLVKEPAQIRVRLSDRRELEARYVGGDALSDLALLKVDASQLPVVRLGHSNKLKVGEWVLAIGSPFGFEHSATAGIVSAKGRNLSSDHYVSFIQTDVATNPGNSGGPLFNLDGEVVGINSQIYSRTGGFMGLSFAIPIDTAMEVVNQLKKNGRVERGWLGVVIHDVDSDLAKSLGLTRPEGTIVAKVLGDGPAGIGGVRPGDVILRYGDLPIRTAAGLRQAVGRTQPGKQVELVVWRAGDRKNLSVEVGRLPEKPARRAQHQQNLRPKQGLGVAVSALPAAQAAAWGINGGVLVTRVLPGPAQRAGLLPGDVIANMSNHDIRTPEDFDRIADSLPRGKWIPMLVVRQGEPLYLALEIR